VHTIYPPVAQAYFRAVAAIPAARSPTLPFQLAAAFCAIATTGLLLLTTRRRGADLRDVILWAWCPAVLIEAAGNAHVDAVAVFLTGIALVVTACARDRVSVAGGGAVLGLAIATKLTPALVLPALARRRPMTLAIGVVAATALVYLPHLIAVGSRVIGFAPGYLAEEGYTDGRRFALVSLIVPDGWAGAVAVLILALVAVVVARSADPDRPWLGAAVMTGAALLVTTPAYPWYALLLVLLVGLGAAPVWLVVVAAGYVAQFPADLHLPASVAQRLGYGVALTAILVLTAVRGRRIPISAPTATRGSA
jgi:hypothetical protein